MRNDQLLQDLNSAVKALGEQYDWLADKEITTYGHLFEFIQDEHNDSELRSHACFVLARLWKVVDKRKAVSPLLIALKSSDEEVRRSAAHALGMLKSKRAFIPLLTILSDKSESVTIRHWVIDVFRPLATKAPCPFSGKSLMTPLNTPKFAAARLKKCLSDPNPLINSLNYCPIQYPTSDSGQHMRSRISLHLKDYPR